jgi:hypothetical protein
MENLGIFYGHWDYFRAIGNILWPFGIFCGNLVFFPVLVFWTKKNLATLFLFLDERLQRAGTYLTNREEKKRNDT